MLILAVVPVLLGMGAMLQAAFNRKLAAGWGLSSAVLLNATVLWVTAFALWFAARSRPEVFPAILRPRSELGFAPWMLLPGLFGLCLVVGLPLALARFGALQVFLFSVAAQIVTSAVWDLLVERLALTPLRAAGALLAIAGAALVTLAR